MDQQLNVLGLPLAPCCTDPVTGFRRNGCCEHDPRDAGGHLVCAQMTTEFLEFSRSRGNDLSTARPELAFPGLKPGDRWCLCASIWAEAFEAGQAPPVVLQGTHHRALSRIQLTQLKSRALDLM